MARKCFIAYKHENLAYKEYIQTNLGVSMIDKSLKEPINSFDEDYILNKIRTDYLSDSTVTIHLIGAYSSENKGWQEQRYIKRELQASLYNGFGNTKRGILQYVPLLYFRNHFWHRSYTAMPFLFPKQEPHCSTIDSGRR